MNAWFKPQSLVAEPFSSTVQLTLFPTLVDDFLAELQVSKDECQRWESKGWLSFDVASHQVLPAPLDDELEFVARIARSGLNDALISKLLESLDRPYRYDPRRVAYSFRDGWVQCPREDDPYDVIEENVHDWLSHLRDNNEMIKLHALRDEIKSLLGDSDDEED